MYSLSITLIEELGAPPSAAALPPVSATGLGLPRPMPLRGGPGSIALQRDLRSCLARKQRISNTGQKSFFDTFTKTNLFFLKNVRGCAQRMRECPGSPARSAGSGARGMPPPPYYFYFIIVSFTGVFFFHHENFSHILLLSLCAALSFLLFLRGPSTAPGPSKPPAPSAFRPRGGPVVHTCFLDRHIKRDLVQSFKSAVDTGTFRVVDTVTGTTYSDTGLTPGSVFYYKVSALNSLGESGQSSAVTASTAVPGHVSAKCTLQTCIVVTWAPVTGAASYNVYRDTSDTGTFLFGRTMTTDTLVDSGSLPGQGITTG